MEPMTEALALMRRALALIDQCDDPYLAGPHLDLAIARLDGGINDNPQTTRPDGSGEEALH